MVKYEDIKSMNPEWDFTEFVELLPYEGTLLELGSFVGKSTFCWAKTFNEFGKKWNIHTVDLFGGLTKMYKESLRINGQEQFRQFKENIEGWDNITWERKYVGATYKSPVEPTALFYDCDNRPEIIKGILETYKDVPFIFIADCNNQFPEKIDLIESLNRDYYISNDIACIT